MYSPSESLVDEFEVSESRSNVKFSTGTFLFLLRELGYLDVEGVFGSETVGRVDGGWREIGIPVAEPLSLHKGVDEFVEVRTCEFAFEKVAVVEASFVGGSNSKFNSVTFPLFLGHVVFVDVEGAFGPQTVGCADGVWGEI
jgi:hypothetical protein